MGTGLARAALRAHRPAFIGTAVAALFAATVVSAATMVLRTTSTDGLSATARARLAENGVGDMATVLLIGSVYMSIFVVASTMGTAVVQQHRELALVRSLGARPRQVRRAVARQALAASVPQRPSSASPSAGCWPGCGSRGWWTTAWSPPRWASASAGWRCPCAWGSRW
ncbi:FtsX-like permease family protein [Streptomyces sp. PmtG]